MLAPLGFNLLASTRASHAQGYEFESAAGLCLSTQFRLPLPLPQHLYLSLSLSLSLFTQPRSRDEPCLTPGGVNRRQGLVEDREAESALALSDTYAGPVFIASRCDCALTPISVLSPRP